MGKKKIRLLLVDDEIDVLNTIDLLLTSADTSYETTKVNSGREAIDYIASHESQIDLIISDINMEEINGAQLAKIVAGMNSSIRIILISGFISLIDQIKHFQLGVERILLKPFDIEELIFAIENPSEKQECSITNMIPVKIGSLIDASKNPVDLYIQLSGDKYLKMFHAKQLVDIKRLQQFLEKDIVFLYAKQDDSLNLDFNLYLPIRISHLKSMREVSFDVFYIHNDDYKRLIPSGSMLTDGALNIIKDHKIKILYIIDKDHLLFLEYLDTILNQYMRNKDVSVDDKISTISNLVQSRAEEAILNPSIDNIINLKKSQKYLIDFLKNDQSTIKDLLKLNEQNKGIHIHSTMVASLSYAMLLEIMAMREDNEEKMKIRALDEYIFESDDAKEIIFTGAILHDLGKPLLQICDSIIQNTPRDDEYSDHMKNHPIAALDKIKSYDVVHPKSLEIILQHEEFCDGSGFPHKIKKTNISFFSQVVILTNYFDKLKRNHHMNTTDALLEIKKTPEKFNRHLIPILERVLFGKK